MTRRPIATLVLIVSASLASLPACARADLIFTVNVNTAVLQSANGSLGPYTAEFDLTGTAGNTATITNFNLGGGTVVNASNPPASDPYPSSPYTFPGASGTLTSTVKLTDSMTNGFVAFAQSFNAGTQFSFTVDLTTTVATVPDTFTFLLYDMYGPLSTRDPTQADSLVSVTINSPTPAVLTYPTNSTDLPTQLNPLLSVPEPSSLILLGLGLAAVASYVRRKRID